MNRLLRHLLTGRRHIARSFPDHALDQITAAISELETRTTGEIVFVVEHALAVLPLLRGESPREHALKRFASERVWDTEENNGVMIYLLLADRDLEIVADRGAAGRIPQERFQEICREMEEKLRAGDPLGAVLSGIKALGEELEKYFPGTGRQELTNQPRV